MNATFYRITVLVLLISSSVFSHTCKSNENQHSITYYTEVYPPSSYYQNDKLIGLSVELIKLIWQAQNIAEQPIRVVPWARGYKEITSRPNIALFSMSKTAQRAPKFKWVGPLFTSQYFIISHPDFELSIDHISDAFEYSIAVVRDDATESIIKESGYPNKQIIAAKSMQNALALFKANRVSLLAISRSGLKSAIKQQYIDPKQFKNLFFLKSVEDYIAFSKETPDEVINQFQTSLDKLKKEHQLLKRKYNLY